MFSKEWLENCSFSIPRYETPAKGGDMKSFKPGQKKDEDFDVLDDDMKEISEKEEDERIKKKYAERLIALKKRRGEE